MSEATKTVYGLQWRSVAHPLEIEFEMIRQGGFRVTKDGRKCGLGLFQHYRNAFSLLWKGDDHHRWSDLGLKAICENDIVVLMGSSDCMAGHTRILNPTTGEQPTIESLALSKTAPTVQTLYGPELAGIPYCKGEDDLVEVVCENGSRFTATPKHRVLSDRGFVFVASLRIGEPLLSSWPDRLESTSDICPSTRKLDEFRFGQRRASSQVGYLSCPDSRGGPLLLAGDNDPTFSQQPTDAQKRISHKHSDGDVQEHKPERNQLGGCAVPRAISDSSLREAFLGTLLERRSCEERISHDDRQCQWRDQSHSAFDHHWPFSKPTVDSLHNGTWNNLSFPNRVSQTRIVSIQKLGRGPFFDIQVPKAHHYFAEGTIHHNSNKTYLMSRFILCDWWAFPDNTLWMVSSTEMRGAELRIWGKLKELFNRARQEYPWLSGTVLESKHAFTTEEISDDGSEGRLLTKGIIFIPCRSNNRWVGMGAFAGIKPTKNGRLGHAGDEVSVMESSFLDAYSNWYGKEHFRGIMSGNPIDIEDPLCTAAEPVEGWDSWHDTEKTQEWRSKFYNAWVVAYDGRDSPNLDFPSLLGRPKYSYLIGKKKLEAVEASEGKDSPLYWMQCVGKPMPGAAKLKVITKQLCDNGQAFENVIWEGTGTTQVAGLDAAYSGIGGDRCVLGRAEFGKDVAGNIVLCFHPPVIVPVSVKVLELPEDQIARFARTWCNSFGIPPENFFFDARATCAVAFARIWSPNVNAVDFGGTPTKRPVSLDEYVWEGESMSKRLKRSDEHYSKFVTELWFSLRYAILGQQVRQLSRDVAAEGYKRLWRFTKGSPPRIEVETKAEMKKRTSQSPDLMDCTVTILEGARRLGFEIRNLRESAAPKDEADWLENEHAKYRKYVKKTELNYS